MKLCVLLSLVCMFGCSLRFRKGEDISNMTKKEIVAFKNNIEYIKIDNNCFAVLNNETDGYRNTFTFATIECSKNINFR